MANALIKAVLKECNKELVADLAPDPAIDSLWTHGILSDREREHIMTVSQSRMRRNGELLDVLRTKDNQALKVLMDYLESEGNQSHLINKLKQSKQRHSQDESTEDDPAGPENDTNFHLSFPHVSKITNILVEDPAILREWGQLKYEFIQKSMDIYEIENLTPNISQQIRRTLELWISRNSEQATFDNLVKILGKDYGISSKALSTKKEEIRKPN